ncbi:hypothetical protein [Mycoplasma phocimorsus]|uniref:hypothetical protein n=1 Tax=Mycoplasma phocimorsus TaxID=3045839 RepID=UPI0024BFE67B|nr:hypothetical protein [Mycoplasma phocimorsus]MDJ1647607.1 hypothetical protein [Mycoplasma phocimorsus]
MNVKNIIKWISTTVGITSSFLISTSVSNSHIYEIQYVNTDNIDVNNLTRKYNSNVETKLIKAKAKNGFIFLSWKLKDETIIDTIEVGTQKNIILSPVLINEYPNYFSIKNLFIDSSSKINFDIRVIKIKQLITKEELAFGNEKYQLQKLIVEAINNFDNKIMQNTILDSHFARGSHVSSNYTSIKFQSNVEKIEKLKENMLKTSKNNLVWKLLWDEVKSWWNNWLGTAFYGLIGVGATIGIGYSAYTAYWKNKRNFKLQSGQKLKIKLDFYPEEDKKNGNWFGYFYNVDSSIETKCECQRRFKKCNNGNNNAPFSISYILTNGPTKPSLFLYNLDDKNNEQFYMKYRFPIKDYYPGSNKISIFGYKNGSSVKEKLGDLIITREIVTDNYINECCVVTTTQPQCKHNSECCNKENDKKQCCIAVEAKKTSN